MRARQTGSRRVAFRLLRVQRPRRASRSRVGALRRSAIWLHRYVGLALAVFLTTAGFTGSLLAFYGDLDLALNPTLVGAVHAPAAAFLDPFEVQRRAQPALPADSELRVTFAPDAEQATRVWAQSAPEKYREYFVNPYSGVVQGSREWGNLSEGIANLMPFVYRLHYSLALDGVGTLLLGIVALLWTLDCFVGAYLTFPPTSRADAEGGPGSWLRRWLPAWRLKTSKLFSFLFSWHRASGLWVWGMLLIFAWSAVALNLQPVYRPVMQLLAGMDPGVHESLPALNKPYPKQGIDLQSAHDVGRRLMAEQATRRGFQIRREVSLAYHPEHGVFDYTVESSWDISSHHPRTSVYFDAQGQRPIGFEAPRGIRAGNTITNYLYALHFAAIGGTTYRCFVSLLGLAVAALSVTGVWIWWRKRRNRVATTRYVAEGAAEALLAAAER